MASADSNGEPPTASFADYLRQIDAVALPNPAMCQCCGEGIHCWEVDAEPFCEACLRERHGFDQGIAWLTQVVLEALGIDDA